VGCPADGCSRLNTLFGINAVLQYDIAQRSGRTARSSDPAIKYFARITPAGEAEWLRILAGIPPELAAARRISIEEIAPQRARERKSKIRKALQQYSACDDPSLSRPIIPQP
jgi:hypothetical protein